jgi:hypothetical protein
MFAEDLDEAVRSFHKLAKFDFEVAVTGHGGPVRGGAADLFRRNLAASRSPDVAVRFPRSRNGAHTGGRDPVSGEGVVACG